MADEDVKRKIKKLLRLSQSPNENEATLALNKANELMEQYKLSKYEVLEDIVCIRKMALKKDTWREILAASISWLYCVYTVHNVGLYCKASERQLFYGKETNVFFASEMYEYLVKTIERICKKNVRANAKTKYRESYKYGVAKNLALRIFILGDKVSWAGSRNEKRTALEKYVKDKVISVKEVKRKQTSKNTNAYMKGYNDGKDIQLNSQIRDCEKKEVLFIENS